MSGTRVGSASAADRQRLAAFLEERGMRYAARLGELHDPLGDEAFVAEDERGALDGVLTYRVVGTECEVTTLYTAASWRGIGLKLIEAAVDAARAAGCDRVWVVTTNDNVDALRFYQRRGFRLAELHVGAVDDSRASLKPSIPEVGDHGIPLHDELVLERRLLPGANGTSGVASGACKPAETRVRAPLVTRHVPVARLGAGTHDVRPSDERPRRAAANRGKLGP